MERSLFIELFVKQVPDSMATGFKALGKVQIQIVFYARKLNML